MESAREPNDRNWVVLMLILLVGLLLYRSCQKETEISASSGVVMPRLLPTPAHRVAPQDIYYVINQERLYCAAITPDLHYTGTPTMQAWWATLEPKMQHWYFTNCQTRPPPN